MLSQAEAQELALLESMEAPKAKQGQGKLSEAEAQELALLESISDEGPGFLSSIGNGIVAAGEFVDSYTGAPTRAAINAGINGQGPLLAFANQFGEDPNLAPTGKEIAQNMGFSGESLGSIPGQIQISEEQKAREAKLGGNYGPKPKGIELPSPAGVAGLGIDIAADPLNFIPLGFVAKNTAKGAKTAVKEVPKFALKTSVAGINAATEAATGSSIVKNSAETVSNYMGRVLETTKNRWNPKRAADFDDFATIAKRENIPLDILPETVEFGTHSTITKKSKNLAEGPGGEAIQKRYEDAATAVEGALENKVAQFGGGSKFSDADAGSRLVESYNNGIKGFFDQDMLTHKKVIDANPGMILIQDGLKSVKSKITGLRNKATALSRRGTAAQRADAKAFLEGDLDILDRSLDKNGNLSYKRAAELLTNIGNEAFAKYPPGAKIPPEIAAKKDLYFTLRDAMYESSAHALGPEAAQELITNNVVIADFLKEKGRISKIFEGDISPDKLFKRIVESGDVNQLQALRTILSPEDFNVFRGAYLDKAIVRSSVDNSTMYRRTMNNLSKKGSAMDILFETDEIKEFSDLLRLGDRVGTFVGNPSQTNTMSMLNPVKWIDNIAAGAADEVALEEMKNIARGKSKAISVPFSKNGKTFSPVNRPAPASKIPIIGSPSRQVSEGARQSSIVERNKEAEKRKRAISGAK